MKIIDSFLNRITMYRLTLYYLIGLLGAAVVMSFFGILSSNPLDILISTCIALFSCLVTNAVLVKFFRAVSNTESVLITALILVLLIPVKFPVNSTFIFIAGVLAMGSKYLVTIEKHHIFNPAAAAVAGIAMVSDHAATWWVGTPALLPFVLLGGLLLVRKIQRESMVFTFLTSYFVLVTLAAFWHDGNLGGVFTTWKQSVFQSSLFFFAFVMFTEPLTSPVTDRLRSYYAYLVAILYATPQLRLFQFALTPELALVAGNIYAYIVNPKYRLELPLKWKKEIGKQTYLFGFAKPSRMKYLPGQYMEWTLPHSNVDDRGIRRYFSFASSPTENDLTMAVRMYQPSSSYKNALGAMKIGETIIASSLAGDFVLPKRLAQPMVFVAGGVGMAPFRSMIQYIVDKKISVDIVVFFANRTVDEVAFVDTLELARKYGVKTIYTLTKEDAVPTGWKGESGYITAAKIKKYVPDFQRRRFYLSGPQLMVQNFEKTLSEMGVRKNNLVIDFFPGYTEKV
jgi:ferredoxin-NADP reductase/Na+-translocating ferredoxin:NAD+ oxidoreductase RnfD subunit